VWTFKTVNGELSRRGVVKGTGYSGHGEGKNNPFMQNVKGVGPLPTGVYWMGQEPFDHHIHGKYCLRLIPVTGTEMYGRAGFLIHGDNVHHPGEASEGCIILDHDLRVQMATSGDVLVVVEDWA
jgi:hypothetical protein